MDRKRFYTESGKALGHIEQKLGELEHEQLDVDLAGDVLTLAFADGGKFIINAHSAAQQIWMAAGTTAWHFDFDPKTGCWLDTKGGRRLEDVLGEALTARLGRPIRV